HVLAGVIGVSLLCVFGVSVLAVDWEEVEGGELGVEERYADGGTTRPLGLKLIGIDGEKLRSEVGGRRSEASLDARLSTRKSTGYLLPFEIASVHLLVVLIGAAYLARAKRRPHERNRH
nr:hypothetical protein [Planctomycetota bacterium]